MRALHPSPFSRAAQLTLAAALAAVAPAAAFVNFETPHVHPLDLSPDRTMLAAVNTAAHTLELFDVSTGLARRIGSLPVGLDPISVRFRTDGEAWVVNRISDSVSVVDVAARRVRATLATDDEPADVVFAGDPQRAFVSCSQTDTVLVFDPGNPNKRPRVVKIGAEKPRALAVSADGETVFAAIFASGVATSLANGVIMAQDAIASGLANERLEELTRISKLMGET